MNSCPNCHTILEQFEVTCHTCNRVMSTDPTPVVADVAPSPDELLEAYRSWIARGRSAMGAGSFEEASNCLREAVKRSRALTDAESREIEARRLLGESLEKQNKIPEAADQYRIISQIATDDRQRDLWAKKSQDLLAASSSLPLDLLFRKEEFRPLLEDERRFVPLYCCGCKRLLAEAEVYGFRRGLSKTVRCWCGIEERPLAKQDVKHVKALESGKSVAMGQRARAIAIAGRELDGGKKRSVAVILALTLGWCGGHKFYLGDRVIGWIYFLCFFTLVPFLLSLYEALILSQMSLITFNMTYNLELVLDQILPEDLPQARAEVFSLEAGESPEEPEEVLDERR